MKKAEIILSKLHTTCMCKIYFKINFRKQFLTMQCCSFFCIVVSCDPCLRGRSHHIPPIEVNSPFSVSENSGKTYHFYFNRYLMNPDMELVRCFGVEYDAEQLCEGILKEVKGVSISDN